MKGVLHVEQALGFLLRDARHRDPGPHRDDLGDLLLVDDRLLPGQGRLPLGAERVDGLAGGRLGLAQGRRFLVFLIVDRRVLLLGDAVELLLGLAQGGRRDSNGASGRGLPASSIRSIALSGRWRSVMYRVDRSAAARTAASLMVTLWCCS